MRRALIILLFVFFFGSLSSWAAAINSAWQELAPGMELRFVTASKPSVVGLVAAQHLEGGPEAQLYFHVGKIEQEMFGSYESGFRENDSNGKAWEIPNVLGVRSREKPKPKKMH